MSKKSFFWPVLSDEEKKQTEKPKPVRVLATSQSGVGMDMGAEFAQPMAPVMPSSMAGSMAETAAATQGRCRIPIR